MHHDLFAWVRLILLIGFVAAFVFWCSITGTDTSMDLPAPEQNEQIYTAQTPTTTIAPTEAETAPEPTLSNPTEETTQTTEAPTIATEAVTEPTETEPPYSPEELDMLAMVIYQEAGADYYSDTTRLMVGTVVMNRIADDRFPDTMHEVLTEESQYGLLHWTGIVWPKRASYPEEAHAVERAYEIAERILLGERALPADVIFQAEFVQGSEIVAKSDDMYFCR